MNRTPTSPQVYLDLRVQVTPTVCPQTTSSTCFPTHENTFMNGTRENIMFMILSLPTDEIFRASGRTVLWGPKWCKIMHHGLQEKAKAGSGPCGHLVQRPLCIRANSNNNNNNNNGSNTNNINNSNNSNNDNNSSNSNIVNASMHRGSEGGSNNNASTMGHKFYSLNPKP